MGTEGIPCLLLLAPAWTHHLYTPQNSDALLCLAPCSLCASVREWTLVVGASHPTMEITPGSCSPGCVMVSLFWETVVWMRVWRLQHALNLGCVFGSAREMEPGLLFTTGMMSSAHPWSCSHAKPPPCLQKPFHPGSLESSRLSQTQACSSVTPHLLTVS